VPTITAIDLEPFKTPIIIYMFRHYSRCVAITPNSKPSIKARPFFIVKSVVHDMCIFNENAFSVLHLKLVVLKLFAAAFVVVLVRLPNDNKYCANNDNKCCANKQQRGKILFTR